MVKEFITIGEGKRRAYIKGMTYKPITLLKRIVGVSLIGYGVATAWLPSGSQLALLGGCALLGIPFKVVWDKFKLYGGRGWYILKVLCSKKRLVYELKALRLRLW